MKIRQNVRIYRYIYIYQNIVCQVDYQQENEEGKKSRVEKRVVELDSVEQYSAVYLVLACDLTFYLTFCNYLAFHRAKVCGIRHFKRHETYIYYAFSDIYSGILSCMAYFLAFDVASIWGTVYSDILNSI